MFQAGCCHTDDTWFLAVADLRQQLFTLLAWLEVFFFLLPKEPVT